MPGTLGCFVLLLCQKKLFKLLLLLQFLLLLQLLVVEIVSGRCNMLMWLYSLVLKERIRSVWHAR